MFDCIPAILTLVCGPVLKESHQLKQRSTKTAQSLVPTRRLSTSSFPAHAPIFLIAPSLLGLLPPATQLGTAFPPLLAVNIGGRQNPFVSLCCVRSVTNPSCFGETAITIARFLPRLPFLQLDTDCSISGNGNRSKMPAMHVVFFQKRTALVTQRLAAWRCRFGIMNVTHFRNCSKRSTCSTSETDRQEKTNSVEFGLVQERTRKRPSPGHTDCPTRFDGISTMEKFPTILHTLGMFQYILPIQRTVRQRVSSTISMIQPTRFLLANMLLSLTTAVAPHSLRFLPACIVPTFANSDSLFARF